MQLSQTGTDKNPLQNRIPGITHILQLVMTIPSLISYYAVKVRRRELRAGGNKLSAARGQKNNLNRLETSDVPRYSCPFSLRLYWGRKIIPLCKS
jgi:hypothetical protein